MTTWKNPPPLQNTDVATGERLLEIARRAAVHRGQRRACLELVEDAAAAAVLKLCETRAHTSADPERDTDNHLQTIANNAATDYMAVHRYPVQISSSASRRLDSIGQTLPPTTFTHVYDASGEDAPSDEPTMDLIERRLHAAMTVKAHSGLKVALIALALGASKLEARSLGRVSQRTLDTALLRWAAEAEQGVAVEDGDSHL